MSTSRTRGLQSKYKSRIWILLQLRINWSPCLDQTSPRLTRPTKFTKPPTRCNASSLSNHYLNRFNHHLRARQEALVSSEELRGSNRALEPQSSLSRRVKLLQHDLSKLQHHCTPVIGLIVTASRPQIPLLLLLKACCLATGPRGPLGSRNLQQTQFVTLLKPSARIPKVRTP